MRDNAVQPSLNIAVTQHCASIVKILLVEDSSTLLTHLTESIASGAEIECCSAATEVEARELIEKNHYDLIILDINLPDSSGNFIGYLVRNNYRVIVMTASEDEVQRKRLASLPIVDYLYKTDEKSVIRYIVSAIKRLHLNKDTMVAICDDSKVARYQIRQLLTSQNLGFIEFEDGVDVYDAIFENNMKIDLLITDIHMPQMDGVTLIQKLRHRYNMYHLPILAQSSIDNHTAIAQVLKTGANDYISKPLNNEEFLTRLNTQLDQSRLYEENNSLISKLQTMATTDFLTQMHNRNYFYTFMPNIQANAIRHHLHYGIIMMDIDYFKKVNDTYGHEAGDIALVSVAKSIQASVRESDVACRWGGEEFLILVQNTTLEEMSSFANRLRMLIEAYPIVIEPTILEFPITASFGVSISDNKTISNVESVIEQADERLYKAKQQGRNCVVSG